MTQEARFAATPSWPERVIVDGCEVPIVIDPMLPDYVGVAEWNLDFQGNMTTPRRIVLRAREERVLLHEVLHCLLGDNCSSWLRRTPQPTLRYSASERQKKP